MGKRKVHVIATIKRPSQVQRDYGRIIRTIGTPAPVPKPRGKSPRRQKGCKKGFLEGLEQRDEEGVKK